MSDVARALMELMEAQRERDAAYDACDVDPDYFCHREDERLNEASVAFDRELRAFVIDVLDGGPY